MCGVLRDECVDQVFGGDPRPWRQLLQTLGALAGEQAVLLLAHTERYAEREVAFFRPLRRDFPVGGLLGAPELRRLTGQEWGPTALWVLRRGGGS